MDNVPFLLCFASLVLFFTLLAPLVLSASVSPSRRPVLPSLSHVVLCLLVPVLIALVLLSLCTAPLLSLVRAPVLEGAVKVRVFGPALSSLLTDLTNVYEPLKAILADAFPFVSLRPTVSDGQPLTDYVALQYPFLTEHAIKQAVADGLRSFPLALPISFENNTFHPTISWPDLPAFLHGLLRAKDGNDAPLRVGFFIAFNRSMVTFVPDWELHALNGTARALRELNLTAFLRMPYLPPATASALEAVNSDLRSLADDLDLRNIMYDDVLSERVQQARDSVLQHIGAVFEGATIDDFTRFVRKSATTPYAQDQLRVLENTPILKLFQTMPRGDSEKFSQSDLNGDAPNKLTLFKSWLAGTLLFAAMCAAGIHAFVLLVALDLVSNRFAHMAPRARVGFAAWTGALTALAGSTTALSLLALFAKAGSASSLYSSTLRNVALVCTAIPVRAVTYAFLTAARACKRYETVAWLAVTVLDVAVMWRPVHPTLWEGSRFVVVFVALVFVSSVSIAFAAVRNTASSELQGSDDLDADNARSTELADVRENSTIAPSATASLRRRRANGPE